MKPINQTTFELNKELIHGLNTELLVLSSSHDLNNEPFKDRTGLEHSNTELVCNSNPHNFIANGKPFSLQDTKFKSTIKINDLD